MTLNVFSILVLCLTTMPCRKMSVLYLLSPGIPTWTSTSRYLLTYQSNVSWKPCILYLTHTYHTQLDSHEDPGIILSEDLCWDKEKTTKPSLHVLTKCWGQYIALFSLAIYITSTIVKLCESLAQSQLLYCTQIQYPHYIERVQHHATKYILNDYTRNSFDITEVFSLNVLL